MTFPWEEADDPVATAIEATGKPLPVAWWGRTSDEEQQDPTLSLPRQLRSCRDVLPANYTIVAHFYDVESGRLDLDQRGKSDTYEAFDIPIPRDGGIQDLLAEAQRPDRRFVAVICESVERVARRTYFGAKVEYELEQAGVMLLAADEPLPDVTPHRGGRAPKRATPILTRRVKQAISEFYVLQMLELSWDGTAEHTEQGWNIGRAPYGYRAERVPHPVAAKRAEGRTKSRLIPHTVEGPTVTRIFQLRAANRLGYRTIADILNGDLDAHPPPTPVSPGRALGRWSGAAVRSIIENPKYTGYMVWNRRATTSKRGKHNPPSAWVWSPQPTHEPLVTPDGYKQAVSVGRSRQGSRHGSTANAHPQTRRNYLLRSYVICDLCDRRMEGKMSRGRPYYACQPNKHHHPQRRDWYPRHTGAFWVREDDLLTYTHTFFTRHIFGVDRHEALQVSLDTDTPSPDDRAASRLEAQLDDLDRRRHNLLLQLEEHQPTGNPDHDRDFRQQLQTRYADLSTDYDTATAKLTELRTPSSPQPASNPRVLDHLPAVQGADLASVPAELLRDLWDSFNLELRYRPKDHSVSIRVSVRADQLPTINDTLTRAGWSPETPETPGHGSTAPERATWVPETGTHVSGTPNGIPQTSVPPASPKTRPLLAPAVSSQQTRWYWRFARPCLHGGTAGRGDSHPSTSTAIGACGHPQARGKVLEWAFCQSLRARRWVKSLRRLWTRNKRRG